LGSILVLAHEHDPNPEMRPLKGNIDVERREKLILGIATEVTAIYRYFAPQRRRMEARFAAEGTTYRQAERKNRTQRSLTLRFENLPPICVFFTRSCRIMDHVG
jgi:hypothetical protein